jgi:hypothetical protein
MASREHPSYSVEMIGIRAVPVPLVVTLYPVQLTPDEKGWWYSIKPKIRLKSQNSPKPKSTSSKTSV